MTDGKKKLPERSGSAGVADFLRKVAKTPVVKAATDRGRLIFAMDATASREPTWESACQIQARMFEQTTALGGLDIQLCYYHGQAGFSASPWLARPGDLKDHMSAVRCVGGMTQIGRVLRHALEETARRKVNAVVFVGDCMEEPVDSLCRQAAELGMRGVPVFVFQEGHDPVAEKAFRRIAGLSGGAYCPFDAGSARQLADLLSAVAVYAAGGQRALEELGRRQGGIAPKLLRQLHKD